MKPRISLTGATSLFVIAAWGFSADALTVYRIGGEHLPLPEITDKPGVDFVQIPWDDVDDGRFGGANQVATSGSLHPQQLDPNVNLTPLIRDWGGFIKSSNGYGWQDEDLLDLAFDGDYDTAYSGLGGEFSLNCGNWAAASRCKGIWVKFNGIFPIKRIVMQPTPEFAKERFIPHFRIGTTDAPVERTLTTLHLDPKHGARDMFVEWRGARRVYFDEQYDIRENRNPLIEIELPDKPISELMFAAEALINWEISEFEIYGEGYASQASYSTNIIDLGRSASLGDLTWAGNVDEGAHVNLTMRTGDDEDPNFYWRLTFRGDERTRFESGGEELSRKKYAGLEGGEKAGISPDTENWEFWSPPVDFASEQAGIVASKPRQFVQFKMDFTSTRSQARGEVEFLQFDVSSPPVASQVLAEIEPTRADLGEVTRFTYKVLPELAEDNLGFDSIEITTPIAPASVDAVRIGNRSLEKGQFEVGEYDGKGFTVKIPHIDLQYSGELIEVEFQSRVFKVGTVFSGRVFDSSLPDEVRQRVTEGDADPVAEGNTLSVDPINLGQDVIRALNVSALTPNSDGVNDELIIEYELVNLSGDVPVAIGVYDLSGTKLVDVLEGSSSSGRSTSTWDGRDAWEELLPPGLYLLRVEVEADNGTDIAISTVPLVY